MSNIQNLTNIIVSEKNNKIIPENIRENITIFNITGNLHPSNSPSREVRNIQENISNIRLFDTMNQMLSNTSNDGDYGVVYDGTNYLGSYIYNITNNNWNPINIGTPTLATRVYNSWFQGDNGVEYGRMTNPYIRNRDEFKDKLTILGSIGTATISIDSNITDTSHLFENRDDLISLPYISFTYSKVQNMEGMFKGCTNISNSSWDRICRFFPNASNLTNNHMSNIGVPSEKITNTYIRNSLINNGYILD